MKPSQVLRSHPAHPFRQTTRSAGVLLLALLLTSHVLAAGPATIQFRISEQEGTLLPCRIHVQNEQGEPQRAAGQPFWRDHFVCSGQASLEVAPGSYRWEIERGPEWQRASGRVEVASSEAAEVAITLNRISDLGSEGWFSGDLHVHRPVQEIEQLMLAEDLDFAPVIVWWNTPARNPIHVPQTVFRFDGHRIYSVMAGEDEREGGALLYFGLSQPLDLSVQSREFPSPMQFVNEARRSNKQVWIDIEKPFWWDVPTWLASGQMNSIGLANNHMCRSQMLANEAWGKPRDQERLPDPLGNGYWTQQIYYQLLNTGLRIPPSAGSASGVLPNPVGYNRVYAHLGNEDFTRDAWFESLRQGRCFVTNGPLLRVQIEGTHPGSILQITEDESLDLSMALTSNDPVSEIEIVYNGKIIQTVPCSQATEQSMNVSLKVSEPGWLLLRAVADVDQTFRFASTAAWYLETAQTQHRISRAACQFFLDWVNERIDRVSANVADQSQRDSVLQWHFQARDFWTKRMQRATAP
jgi:hypothetical protein